MRSGLRGLDPPQRHISLSESNRIGLMHDIFGRPHFLLLPLPLSLSLSLFLTHNMLVGLSGSRLRAATARAPAAVCKK